MNKGKYYMTTAIAYTSGKPHMSDLSDKPCRGEASA